MDDPANESTDVSASVPPGDSYAAHSAQDDLDVALGGEHRAVGFDDDVALDGVILRERVKRRRARKAVSGAVARGTERAVAAAQVIGSAAFSGASALAAKAVEAVTSFEKPGASPTPPLSEEVRARLGAGEKVRVCMISLDRKIFEEGSQAQHLVLEYGLLFSELHIIIYTLANSGFKPMRIAANVFLYPTNSASRWLYPFDAYRVANRDVRFGGDFRADVVTGQDPFETGLAAWLIARRFGRRVQLQLHTDLYDPYFKDLDPLNWFRLLIASFLLPRAHCVRVVSDSLRDEVIGRYPRLAPHVGVLPIYTDLSFINAARPTFDLHKKYPQFTFLILMASRLTPEKNIPFAIDVFSRIVMRYPRTGLIIVGEGRERQTLERLVAARNLQGNVFFEPWTDDLVSYYKTANMFLLTSVYEGYGRTLIEAAASGVPIVTSNVGVAPSYFKDGENAFVCPVNDAVCFESKIAQYINSNEIRLTFRLNAKEALSSHLLESREDYLVKYRQMIETCAVGE